MNYHNINDYLLDPPHKVTVALIGCGGTGSQVLSILGRMNKSLVALDHPGLHVTVFDSDIVTEANVGMQLLWRLFREGKTPYHGVMLNLDDLNTNPIKI